MLWLNVVYSKNMKTILAHFKHEKFRVLKEKKYHCNNFLSIMNVTCSKTRGSRPDVFCKKGVLKSFQYSQENTNARVSFFTKERFQHGCFPSNFVKFLRAPIL